MSTGVGVIAPKSQTTTLAVASIAVWFAAAASAGVVGIWSAIGGAAVALGVAILCFDRHETTPTLRPGTNSVLLGAAVGIIMAAGTYILYPLLVHLLPFIATDTARLYAAFRAPSATVAVVALIPIIVGEELVWRGVVQTSLVRRLGPWIGVGAAALVYALVHTPLGSPVLMAAALCCGLIWGALRVITGSLVPTLVAHLLWNVLVLLWLPLDAR